MQKVIAIVGPTAVGKSALAVRLARKFKGEVISADSRQVYRGLNVGTGKITRKEMGGVPHHLLDVADPRKQFSVAEYQTLAREKIWEIFSRGRVPIICGGTGLYVDSLLKESVFPEVPPDTKLRKQMEKKSAPELFSILKKLDSRRAKMIDRHNPRRLIRAIEIAKALGRVPLLQHSNILENVGMLFIGLTIPGKALKKSISDRLRERMQSGMIREVKKLHIRGLSWTRMEELGLEYRYVARYLKNKTSKSKMVEELQNGIWRYAKRQMTWFRRNREIQWFSPSKVESAVSAFLKR